MTSIDAVVGTYNMSFASDLGISTDQKIQDKVRTDRQDSEIAFLMRQRSLRQYWKNALKLLEEFIDQKKPVVVGLQEMNIWTGKDPKKMKGGYVRKVKSAAWKP
jgi:hypothetical protein